MSTPIYKRVLIKLSGEVLAEKIEKKKDDFTKEVAAQIKG